MMTAGDHVKLAMSRLPGLQELEAKTLFAAALRWLYSKYKWSFLIVDQILTTEAPYTTGTLTATAGTPNLVGSGTAWDATWAKRKIVVSGRSEIYEFVPSGATAAKLQINGADVNWPGDTASELTYTVFRDTYSLSSVIDWGRDYFWWDPAQACELPIIDRYAMLGLKVRTVGIVGTPAAVCRGSLVQATETTVPAAAMELGPLAPDNVYSYNFVGFKKATAPTVDGAYPLWLEEFEDCITDRMEVVYADSPRHRVILSPLRRQEINLRLWECFKRNDGGAEIFRLKQLYQGSRTERPFSNARISPATGAGSTDWNS